MTVAIKFCGLTRPADASAAISEGASYLGAIFADSPRQVRAEQVRRMFWNVGEGVRSVGVFGAASSAEIADTASHLGLDIVQLHADPTADDVLDARDAFDGEIWAAVRTADGTLDGRYEDLFELADGIVIDARVDGKLGGTGVAVDWARLSESLAVTGRPRTLILAGGLRPDNVEEAVRIVRPDVVDVASGVETAPGIKDPAKLRAFAAAVLRGTEEA